MDRKGFSVSPDGWIIWISHASTAQLHCPPTGKISRPRHSAGLHEPLADQSVEPNDIDHSRNKNTNYEIPELDCPAGRVNHIHWTSDQFGIDI